MSDTEKADQYQLVLAQNAPSFTIVPKELTIADVTLASQSKEYDGSYSVPLTAISLSGICGNDDVSVDMSAVLAVVSDNQPNSYDAIEISSIYLTGSAAGNYRIASSVVVPVSFTILPSQQSPSVDIDGSSTGDGSPTGDGSSGGDGSPTGDGSSGGDGSPTGGGSPTGDGSPTGNNFTVLTVRVDPKSIYYGDPLPQSYSYRLFRDNQDVTTTLQDAPQVSIEIVGNGASVGFYPYKLKESTVGNYQLVLDQTTSETAGLTVLPKLVEVQFQLGSGWTQSGDTAQVQYDGTPKTLAAHYFGVDGQSVPVQLQYLASDVPVDAPTEIGVYQVVASITDPNYDISSYSITRLEIKKKEFTPQNIERRIKVGDTTCYSVPLSDFGVPEDAWAGVYVYQVTYTNGVILTPPSLVNDAVVNGYAAAVQDNKVFFQLLAQVQVGQSADIELRTSSSLYEETSFHLHIVVDAVGYSAAVTGAPARVTLGSDIALSQNFQLVITYDNNTTVKEPVTAAMLSGYNKNDTGTASIGNKVITVNSQKVSGASATFVIEVMDRATGLVVVPPDKLTYTRGSSRLNLDGGSVALRMQSGIAQPKKALTASMLSVGSSILNRAGSYDVDVRYNGWTVRDAFTIEVIRGDYGDSENIFPVTEVPSRGDFGMNLSRYDIEDLDGYSLSDLYLMVDSYVYSDDQDELLRYIRRGNWDDYEMFEAWLETYDGYPMELRRSTTLYLPYPSGVSRTRDTIGVYHLVNGRVRTEKVTLLSNHIAVTVDSLSPFAVVWREKNNSSGSSSGSSSDSSLSGAVEHQQEMEQFWKEVVDLLEDTASGRTLSVNAGDYDYVPVSVLKAIRGRNVTLKIINDYTNPIVLNGKNLPASNELRTSYTMRALYNAVKENSSASSSGGSGSTGTSISQLEKQWNSVVKSLQSYSAGTVVTVNAKNQAQIPGTFLEAIRGRNITVKLKSDRYATMTLNGMELPVTLKKQDSYTLQQLYEAVTPPSSSQLEKQWESVVKAIKGYQSGTTATVNAKSQAFVPETLLAALRGRNITVKLQSDYLTQTITLYGQSMPTSLSGQRAYSIAELYHRAKQTGSAGTVGSENGQNPTTGMQAVLPGIWNSSSSASAMSVVSSQAISTPETEESSSQSVMLAPPVMDLPAGDDAPVIDMVDSAEPDNDPSSMQKMYYLLAGVFALVAGAILLIMTLILSSRRRRRRRR